MMEAARTSETSLDIPEDSELHTRRRENLKSDTIDQSGVLFTLRDVTAALLKILHSELTLTL
jgi:hypothetical protein